MKNDRIRVHKANTRSGSPRVSLILLDWTVRESFHGLDWLSRQDADRDDYEVIWVELYDRAVPEAMERADVVMTCGQKGVYHKHEGYNAGLLHAGGHVVTVCDSDAVFPPDFVTSIIAAFEVNGVTDPKSLVLMHYEQRTKSTYPAGLSDFDELKNYEWLKLWPNVGACMSVTKADAIRFGGFDEHRSFRGFVCGPYDLGWRLVNTGLPEVWHDERVTLWHFSHPNPPAGFGQSFSFLQWRREVTRCHVKYHALTAVEAFSTGRVLPLKENVEIHSLRMRQRRIGTEYEEEYAQMTGPTGFTAWHRARLYLSLIVEPFRDMYWPAIKRRCEGTVLAVVCERAETVVKATVGGVYGALKRCRQMVRRQR